MSFELTAFVAVVLFLILLIIAGLAIWKYYDIIFPPHGGGDSGKGGNGGNGGNGGGGNGGNSGGGNGGDGGTVDWESQPTRMRVTNKCNFPIWLNHSKNLTDPQSIKLDTGKSHDYKIPDEGLMSTRFWAKTGCDESGNNCSIGQSDPPCPEGGCQPPIESKMEASWAAINCPVDNPGADCVTWYNASQVDGFTLPYNIIAKGPDVGKGGCVSTNGTGLKMDICPTADDLSGGKPEYSKWKSVDLTVRDSKGEKVGCIAPCKKLNYPAPWGFGMSESVDPALHMCCPTPAKCGKKEELECVKDGKPTPNCKWANGCATSETCSDPNDPLSIVNTGYYKAIKKAAPGIYAYAYDDADSLHTCTGRTKFELVFCP